MREDQYSIACLIAGIMSCVLCCVCLGFPLGIVGIILFILSGGHGHGVDEKAGFGLALSILGILLSVIMVIFIAISSLGRLHGEDNNRGYYNYDIPDYYDDYDNDEGEYYYDYDEDFIDENDDFL